MGETQRIAEFEKVPFEQFKADAQKQTIFYRTTEEELRKAYDSIVLPVRSTAYSAGYDIRTPFTFTMDALHPQVLPTGLRCKIEEPWFLNILPRSGSGFKYGLHLANTCGIIDADYYDSDNYGHIMLKLVLDEKMADCRNITFNAGNAIAQGIFMQYGLTVTDNVTAARNGGFGSTG